MTRCAEAPTFYVCMYVHGKRTWRVLYSLTNEQLQFLKLAVADEESRREVLTQKTKHIWQPVPTGVR